MSKKTVWYLERSDILGLAVDSIFISQLPNAFDKTVVDLEVEFDNGVNVHKYLKLHGWILIGKL